ncbi:DUF3429 domain-containing protein [Sphingomicrobium astaxanthinifaciens]|uniref:DUF3429 domain-containing protein n=1 Tax=Sphingomicrobium astaxanthinifaciens TaxID=1227949 RepID=UPI001FCBD1C8|nr:DUF3429 domain-containing protein [Sphingomicrobium astaxanthinifaciens]MCJ7422097.1 DUF3429 domain-containing protein [Sphingomicrobium astaxanthinifaciens]
MRPFGLPPLVLMLGAAGLLPPVALIALVLVENPATHDISFWGVIYGALILTFLGGCWWAFASNMRPVSNVVLVLSVLPSLGTFVMLVGLFSFAAMSPLTAGLVVGGALWLSPLIDRYLSLKRVTPRWWMTLRVPLSAALGLLTIVSGWLAT